MDSLSGIRPLQIAIAEFAQLNRALPTAYSDLPSITDGAEENTCAGISQTNAVTTFPAADGTTITVTSTFYSNGDTKAAECGGGTVSVPQPLSGNTLVFTGTMNAQGVVNWTIDNSSTVAAAYRPSLR
ncbi:pilin [Marinobacter shengliensis]